MQYIYFKLQGLFIAKNHASDKLLIRVAIIAYIAFFAYARKTMDWHTIAPLLIFLPPLRKRKVLLIVTAKRFGELINYHAHL